MKTITIEEFKRLNPNNDFTANLKIMVSQANSPKEGISKLGKKYKMQQTTISDLSGEMNLNVFDTDIGKFVLGKTYEICDIGVDTWNDSIVPRLVPNSIIRELASSSDDFLKDKQEEIKKILDLLPDMPPVLKKLGIEKSTEMYQLKLTINENISKYETLPNQGMIWQMTESIYSKYESNA